MDFSKAHQLLLRMMTALNFVIVLFLSLTISVTAGRIAESGQARAFFDQIAVIPFAPRLTPVYTTITFLLLLAVMAAEKRPGIPRLRKRLLLAVTLTLLLTLTALLRMGYSGCVLLVAVELLTQFETEQTQTIFIGGMTVLFLCSDYDLISLRIPMVSFQEYLFYYNANTANLLLSTKNVLVSIHMLLFVAVMVEMSLAIVSEHDRALDLNKELERANQRIMEYAIESERAAETRERNRLAREIHDTMGHTLTGISVGLDACLTLAEHSPEKVGPQLLVLAEAARRGLRDVRRSVHALGPDALEELDTAAAIRKLTTDTAAASGVQVTLDSVLDQVPLQRDEADTVYRIIQESMTNAIRHGHADRIHVRIKTEGRWLVVLVRDNGVGCTDFAKGFGLRHMEERIALLGGRLLVKNSNGFTVFARLNIRWRDENDQGTDSGRSGADPSKPANRAKRL